MKQGQKIKEIVRRLRKACPAPKTALRHANPFQLLAATILSAQTTDVHVNKVTEGLFRKYRDAEDFASADPEVFRKEVRSINFYNTKAKNIQASARLIMDRHAGNVPKTMEELTALPGVARKTANIVLSGAFGIQEGIAVDTHVKRLANRLGLTSHNDPVKIEQDLMASTPRKDWSDLSLLLIFHGRQVCLAKKPDHLNCVLADICPSRDL